MIGTTSFFNVVDNSGADIVQCLRVSRLRYDISNNAKVGDFLTIVVKKSHIPKTVKRRKFAKKSDVLLAVMVTSVFGVKRFSSVSSLNFFNNSVVLLKKDDRYIPFATRVLTSVPSELRDKGFLRIISLSNDIY